MGTHREEDRRRAIRRYLSGEKPAAICASMGYSRVWLYKWRKRSQGTTEAWWEEQSRRPRAVPTRTTREIEEIVTVVRLSLYNRDLFCGAQAIRWELEELGVQPRPSLRTIARILACRELTHRRTGRYEPKGKTYPALTIAHPGDVHQTDFVGPCYLTGPVRFYSLHSVDVATGRCAVEPLAQRAGQHTVDAQLDRALPVLRLAGLPDEVRGFIAAALEDELEWEREVREARQAPRAFMQPTWFFLWDERERYPHGWWCP